MNMPVWRMRSALEQIGKDAVEPSFVQALHPQAVQVKNSEKLGTKKRKETPACFEESFPPETLPYTPYPTSCVPYYE